MKTVYLERSTGDCRCGDWAEKLDLTEQPDRIVVGTGPGSFAGIRSALAFAQGYAIGSGCEVLGLPSACALAAQTILSARAASAGEERELPVAVVGDARRGKLWSALFSGFSLLEDVFQVDAHELEEAVAARFARHLGRERPEFLVTTPDAARIDGFLRETFGARYLGGQTPTAEGLEAFAEANPAILTPEPLPIYLNPAVRE